MPTGDVQCPWCGARNPFQPHFCIASPAHPYGAPVEVQMGRYQFYPHQLTEADFRRIVREELERSRSNS